MSQKISEMTLAALPLGGDEKIELSIPGSNPLTRYATVHDVLAAAVQTLAVACSDEVTAISAGTAKITFRSPFASAFTVTGVKASLTVAQASGSILTVDINEGGSTILSTKLTIDNTEKTSTTAATPPVISDASIAADAEITIDVDQIGDGTAKGLKVCILGHL